MSRKTVKKNLFAGKHYIFVQFFGLWAQENSDFCLELLAWVPELNSLSPQEKFDRNLNFLKKKLNLSSSMLTFKLKYSFFGFDTSAGLSKVQVTCPLEFVFQICCFLSKFHNLSSTFSVWMKQFGVSGTIAESFSKLFYVSILTIRGVFVSMKNVILFSDDFGTWETRLCTFAILAKSKGTAIKTVFRESRGRLCGQIIFLKLYSFHVFSQESRARKSLKSSKISGMASKLHSFRPVKNSQGY